MKGKFSSIWRVAVALVLALSFSLMPVAPVMADTAPVNLGSAANFAVLGGSGITNTGATTINGDVGTHPTPTITGFGSVTLNGTNHGGDTVTETAKADLITAYNDAAGRTPVEVATELGGTNLGPGVYDSAAGTFGITGNLTLTGDTNAVWIFQAASTLITAAGSQVILSGGARASNVFWKVGSSATLGANSVFRGNILASASITISTGATVYGRALASGALVTLDTNTISMPPTWVSYSDSGRTTVCETYTSSYTTAYMRGTGFPNISYFIAYYDADGTNRGSETQSASSGTLNSAYLLTGDQTAAAGIWHALVQPSSGYTGFGTASYATIVASPDTYGLLANDSFTVEASAIPEFPTVMAGIAVVVTCAAIYWWMRKRRLAYVQA